MGTQPSANEEVAPGIVLLDSQMFDHGRFGGVYLLRGSEPILVESGTSRTVDRVVAALKEAQVKPGEVRHILLTHIHLDHAGGAGFLLEHMPRARVWVHERGLKHLHDPSRLLESASVALGKAMGNYGTLKPVPLERLSPLRGGEVLDLGGRRVEVHYTPGHARHHVAFVDALSRSLFTGDAGGIYLPRDRVVIPTTPFPEFDLPTALETMEGMKALEARQVMFTHFGPRFDAAGALEAEAREVRRWDLWMREARGDPVEELAARIYEEHYGTVRDYDRPFVERIIETNIRGFRAYYERKGGP